MARAHAVKKRWWKRFRRIGEAQNPGPSPGTAAGVTQPAAATDTLHPQLTTTAVQMSMHLPRIWAQLHVEQGSSKTKRELEREYSNFTPDIKNEWEHRVKAFCSNNCSWDQGPGPRASANLFQI